jgi:hypothetical protein
VRPIGEEAAAALGPDSFAIGIILRLPGEYLALLQFVRERIGGRRGTCSVVRRARWSLTEVQRGGDNCDSDQGEAGGARDGGKIEETAAH